jgi:hypothetical protein
MGIAAGGKMTQKIYPDSYGIDTWDEQEFGRVYVHIVNSMMYRQITGEEPPATPVTAQEYAEHGLPWYALYDKGKGDIGPSDELAGVKSVAGMDEKKGFACVLDDSSVEIPPYGIKKLPVITSDTMDGKW